MSHPHSSSGSYLFCSQSTAISVASAGVFVCGGIHKLMAMYVFVSSEGVSRSKGDEAEDSSQKTSQNKRI